MKIIATENASATQTEHPWRATARTFVQNITGTALAILGILIFVPGAMDTLAGILAELGLVLPASIILLPPLIARFMAIPGVERALRKIGLGAAPTDPSFGTWDGGSDEAEVDDLSDETELQAVEEVDLTPPPEGYEPRH